MPTENQNSTPSEDTSHAPSSKAPIPPAGYSPTQLGDQTASAPNQTQESHSDSKSADFFTKAPHETNNLQTAPDDQNPQNSSQTPTDTLSSSEKELLAHGRKLAMFAGFGSIVSFFIGGVLLSAICLVAGILSYRRISAVTSNPKHDQTAMRAFKRMGISAIALPAVALALNAIALALIIPEIMQMAQTGTYSDLFNFGTSTGAGGSSTSTWG